jgi:hypothetical protein
VATALLPRLGQALNVIAALMCPSKGEDAAADLGGRVDGSRHEDSERTCAAVDTASRPASPTPGQLLPRTVHAAFQPDTFYARECHTTAKWTAFFKIDELNTLLSSLDWFGATCK